ncbi:MAG: arsenate reductase (glutaredoxin) [Caulobacterales bacterium]
MPKNEPTKAKPSVKKPAAQPKAAVKAKAPAAKAKTAAAKPAAQAAAAVTVWHNPACGSSKNAIAYLEEKGVQPEIFAYLKAHPTKAQIKAVLKQLKLKPADLLRPNEAKGEALGVYAGASEEAILEAMAAEPILIQRPIVITEKGAVIARPKTRIDDVL